MKLLKFYGSSDDLFCIEGGTRRGDPEEIPPARSVAITSSEGGLIVGAIYSPADNGCWMIGVCQVGEETRRCRPGRCATRRKDIRSC